MIVLQNMEKAQPISTFIHEKNSQQSRNREKHLQLDIDVVKVKGLSIGRLSFIFLVGPV